MRLFSVHRSGSFARIVSVSLGLLLAVTEPSIGWPQSPVQEARERYLRTADQNHVTELFAQVDTGDVVLEYEPGFGYLRSILRVLEIPISSQSLVFSKTSLQMRRISPENPRAIYFNDDVYIAWVQGSPLLEISTTDPQLGAAFYTFQMSPYGTAIRRENDRCLGCHKIPMTQGVPGHAVRSVLTRASGTINGLTRSSVTDHTSPIAQRWGGWYVSGDLGGMQHMGNAFLEGDEMVPRGGDAHRADLSDDFDTSLWPSPHSDVVALMVLEHQTQMHNTFTRAHEEVRLAADHDRDADANEGLEAVVDRSAKSVVDSLLFVNEATLHAPIRGSTRYAEEFTQRGPASDEGNSLRDFDLNRRLFRYPCSYLIYSSSFASLDERLRQRVYQRLWSVLTGQDTSAEYAHLSGDDRAAILRILRQTKSDLPADWDQL